MGALQFFLFVWQRRPNENILLMIMFRVADCHVNATALCVRVLLLPLYIHTHNLTHKVHQIVGLHITREQTLGEKRSRYVVIYPIS